VYLHHKDGYRKPVCIRVVPLRNDYGEIHAALELFNDKTPEEALKQRMTELEKLAMFDELTKLPNRRYVEERLEDFMNDFMRHKLRFGVIFMDIDHFKSFNDTYGHVAGDKVLKIVANTLLGASRVSDVVGRWGGEEFVALIKNVNMKTIETIAERYRLLVESSSFELNGESLSVTISIGATLAKQGDTKESIIKRADELMYISKQRGRNRLTIG
jgi:diguanylate cyclase (GGDEF)-like protein